MIRIILLFALIVVPPVSIAASVGPDDIYLARKVDGDESSFRPREDFPSWEYSRPIAGVFFIASETGVMFAEGRIILGGPDIQIAHIEAHRHGGTGVRSSIGTATEALTANTDFAITAYVANGGDSVEVLAYEVFAAGI